MTLSALPRTIVLAARSPVRRLPPPPLLVLGLLVAALCLLAPFYLVGRVVQSPGAALDEILARIRNDFLSDQSRAANDAFVESLMERYEIVIADR